MSSLISDLIVATALVIVSSMIVAAFMTYSTNYISISSILVKSFEVKSMVSAKVVFTYYNSSGNEILVWIKNTGLHEFTPVEISRFDVILVTENGVEWVPYRSSTLPSWVYSICNDVDNDGMWDPGETICIKISLANTLSGEFKVKIVLPYGHELEGRGSA